MSWKIEVFITNLSRLYPKHKYSYINSGLVKSRFNVEELTFTATVRLYPAKGFARALRSASERSYAHCINENAH